MSTKNADGKGTQGVAIHKTTAPVKSVEQTQKPKQPNAASEQPPKEPKALSVEDKINKVEQLTELIEKRVILKAHLNRVESLKFGEFDEKDALTITSKSDNSYTITNSSLMSDIASLCKDRISNEILKVEQLIEF